MINSELIERYFDKSLSESEKVLFAQKYKGEPDFTQAVNGQALIISGLKAFDFTDVEEIKPKWYEKIWLYVKKNRLLIGVAVVVVAIVLYLIFRDTTPSPLVVPTPAVSTPAASTPAVSTPIASTPVASTPAVPTPAVSTPVASTPVNPAVITPVITEPAPPLSISDEFVASGYMGCHKGISITASTQNPHSGSTSIKVEYARNCADGWAGAYWQNVANNWGEFPGMDLSEKGYTKITFFARGATGTELVEFGSGGIINSEFKYKDSYKASIAGKTVALSTEWQQFTIPLTGKNLKSAIGGFFWVAKWTGNPMTFYLDDIQFE